MTRCAELRDACCCGTMPSASGNQQLQIQPEGFKVIEITIKRHQPQASADGKGGQVSVHPDFG